MLLRGSRCGGTSHLDQAAAAAAASSSPRISERQHGRPSLSSSSFFSSSSPDNAGARTRDQDEDQNEDENEDEDEDEEETRRSKPDLVKSRGQSGIQDDARRRGAPLHGSLWLLMVSLATDAPTVMISCSCSSLKESATAWIVGGRVRALAPMLVGAKASVARPVRSRNAQPHRARHATRRCSRGHAESAARFEQFRAHCRDGRRRGRPGSVEELFSWIGRAPPSASRR